MGKGIYLANAGGDMAAAAGGMAKSLNGEGYEVGLYAPLVWGCDNVLESAVGLAREAAGLAQDASSLASYFYPATTPISEQAVELQPGVDVDIVKSDCAMVRLMKDVTIVVGAAAPAEVLVYYKDGRTVKESDLIKATGDLCVLVVPSGEDAAHKTETTTRALAEEGVKVDGVILTDLEEEDVVVEALVAAAAAAPLVACVNKAGVYTEKTPLV